MAEPILPDEQSNFETFRDCFSEPVLKALAKPIAKPTKKKRVARRSKDGKDTAGKKKIEVVAKDTSIPEDEQATAEDLSEFIDVQNFRTPFSSVMLTMRAVPLRHHLPLPPLRPPHPLLR